MNLYKINLNVVSVSGYFPTAIIPSLIRETCMCELRVVITWIYLCGLNVGPNLTLQRICSQLAVTFVVQ